MAGRARTLSFSAPELPRPPDNPSDWLRGFFSCMSGIIDLLRGKLSFGPALDGYGSGHLDGQYLHQTFSAVADSETEIWHGLGRKPVGYIVVDSDRACSIYSSSRSSWTDTAIKLKSDTASAVVVLLIF